MERQRWRNELEIETDDKVHILRTIQYLQVLCFGLHLNRKKQQKNNQQQCPAGSVGTLQHLYLWSQ